MNESHMVMPEDPHLDEATYDELLPLRSSWTSEHSSNPGLFRSCPGIRAPCNTDSNTMPGRSSKPLRPQLRSPIVHELVQFMCEVFQHCFFAVSDTPIKEHPSLHIRHLAGADVAES